MQNIILLFYLLAFSSLTYACYDKEEFNLHKTFLQNIKTKKQITDAEIANSYVQITDQCKFKHSHFKSIYENMTSIQKFSPEFALSITNKLLTKDIDFSNLQKILLQPLPKNILELKTDLAIDLITALSKSKAPHLDHRSVLSDFDLVANDCTAKLPEYKKNCQTLTAKYFIRSLNEEKNKLALFEHYKKVKTFVYESIKTKANFNFEYYGFIFTVLNTGQNGIETFINIFNSMQNDNSVGIEKKFNIA